MKKVVAAISADLGHGVSPVVSGTLDRWRVGAVSSINLAGLLSNSDLGLVASAAVRLVADSVSGVGFGVLGSRAALLQGIGPSLQTQLQ